MISERLADISCESIPFESSWGFFWSKLFYNLLYCFSVEITLFRLSTSIGFNFVRLYFPTDLSILSWISNLFEWSWTMKTILPMHGSKSCLCLNEENYYYLPGAHDDNNCTKCFMGELTRLHTTTPRTKRLCSLLLKTRESSGRLMILT